MSQMASLYPAKNPSTPLSPPAIGLADDLRFFQADVVTKRSESWTGGKAILLERRPHGQITQFAHCLGRHTITMHLDGANTSTTLRYDGGPRNVAGSTIGQTMFVPAGHRLEGSADFPSRIRHLVLLFDPKLAEEDIEERVETMPYQQSLKDGIVAGQMRALQNELDYPGPMSRLFVQSLCCEIAVRIFRMSKVLSPARASGGLAPRRLRSVKDYIEAQLSGNITLSDLAAVAGISRSHFSRAFRVSTGIGAHRYIISQRIEQAKRLLTGSDMPIAEVALAAGFGNQSHLTTHFRREIGTTPARFRALA